MAFWRATARRMEPGIPLQVKLLTWIAAALSSVVLAAGVVSIYIAVRYGPRALIQFAQSVSPVPLPTWLPGI